MNGIDELYDVVGKLIKRNACHRSGERMGSISTATILKHLQLEVDELVDALSPDSIESPKAELCDVLGVVLHLAHRLSMDKEELYSRCSEKFDERFT